MAGRSRVDLVVVGAGAAGLAAAKTARSHGLDVIVCEASHRIGGRAYTLFTPFGVPWDAGCHWLHSASINPFRRIAEAEGFHYRTTRPPWHAWLDGRLLSEEEELAIDAYTDRCVEEAARRGREGEDLPVASVTERANP